MQLRYVRTDDLDVLEGTVNLLLAQGWELYTNAFITHTNDYFVTLVNYPRSQRGSARVEDIPPVRGPQPCPESEFVRPGWERTGLDYETLRR